MSAAQDNSDDIGRESSFAEPAADKSHVFRTITGPDWARSIADARARPNAIVEQIRQKFLALGLGDFPKGVHGNSTKEMT